MSEHKSYSMNEKLFYNTVQCQTFSPDGQYLAAGNIYGAVSIYELSKALGPYQDHETDPRGPNYRFTAYPDQQVHSIVATDKFLITGTVGEISGWDWNTVISNKVSKIKVSWSIQIPTVKDSYERPDVNYMVLSKEDNLLHAGCGDNKIYTFSLEDGKLLRTLEGHEDFIHALSLLGNQLASASEDGSVRLWDLRQKETLNIVKPFLAEKVARPRLGKWIGTVDFTEDWLLCGGGPKLALWHMRTMEAATIFELPDQGIHSGTIYEERVIVGGAMPSVQHLNYQGEILAEVLTSSNTIYSIVYQDNPPKLLSMAGSSNNIDICTNFSYREMTLKFA
ncbi:THO complex subunit 6 homolog [Athalia rosae]|uniref:THO complex subunit 6 homolog n=1 Tax=Athalia rosae TaxID=37344 RepID=UPI00203494EE|nr:THO complex subunit 6 homolog [Athalia rosae]